MLGATPSLIAETVSNAPSRGLRSIAAPGEWSASEVLAHLRACADVWGGCMSTILSEDEPTIRAVNPTTWIASTDYMAQEFQDLFTRFKEQRAELLSRLEPLTQAEWLRGAVVTGAGRPRRRTVLDYAHRLGRHEQSHVDQIRRIVGARAAQ